MDGPNVLQGASHVEISGGTIIATNEMVILNQYGSHRSPYAVQKACAAISFAGQQYQLVKGNKERCKILIQRCKNILIPLCTQVQSEGLPDSMLDNIRVLENVCISIRDIVIKLASQSFAWRLLNQDKTDGDMKAIEAKLLDAISIFNISAHADGVRLQREFADSLAEAAAKDQSELVAYLDNLSQNDYMILHSLRENHLRMEELLVALTKHVQVVQSTVTATTTPSEKFIRHAVGALQRLSKEPVVNPSGWQLTSLEVTFNHDDLESQIGQGSFGNVFKGQWHGEVVAVKEMYIEDARNMDRNLLKTLHNEIAIWSKLTHPRVVQFYGACLEATRPFMVSRFCSNGNVIEYLRKNPTKNRLELLHQVSLGMAFLHSQSVIHADLKGANILIEGEGNALLSDFGISQLKDHTGTSSLNRTGIEKTRGTLRWMAPELLYGGKLDFAVDVYTFGITAWELYTLEVPFSNVPERALHYRIIDKRERPTCPPTMDSELTNLVIQCWAHEAVSRPTFKTISMSISTIVTNVYRELTLKVIADEEKRKRETKENSEKERVVPTRREREETEARRERIEKEIEEKEAKQDKEKTAMLRRENKTKVGEDQAASERASEKIREKGSLVTQGNGQNDTATNEVNTTKGTGLGIGIPPVVTNKTPPIQLMPSPSSGARGPGSSVLDVLERPQVEVRGRVSEGDAIPSNTGVSQQLLAGDSNYTRQLKPSVPPLSIVKKEKQKDTLSIESRHTRGEKGIDKSEAGDRRGLFGFALNRSTRELPTPISLSTSLSEVSKEDIGEKYGGNLLQHPTTRFNSNIGNLSQAPSALSGEVAQGQRILDQIGEPDHEGWLRKKGDRMNIWTLRYFVLKGPHLYHLRNNQKSETKLKGYIHVFGYKVVTDENVDPGRYGFRLVHDSDKTHYFSSEDSTVIREWIGAIMKATIGRVYTTPVVSSNNVPTIPISVAQAMNPGPQPPSAAARATTQKALRRENPNLLSSRDAQILMGLRDKDDHKHNALSSISSATPNAGKTPQPSRVVSKGPLHGRTDSGDVIVWANTHLPVPLRIFDPSVLCDGLGLLRIAESIKGRPLSPTVPDNAFPSGPTDDKLTGLFRLFDFLLDNNVKMGSVSINDIRQGNRDKVLQLLRALKHWDDKTVVTQSHHVKTDPTDDSLVEWATYYQGT